MIDLERIDEDMQEEFNLSSMNIILHAGNAREKIHKSLKLCSEKKFNEANALIEEAYSDFNQAHKLHTHMVQKESRGENYYYSMLFAHAQDTLMTVQSEYNIITGMIEVLSTLLSEEK